MFFKSLKWRLVSIFFLLVISIMVVVGTYLLFAVEKAYKDEFISQMQQSVEAFSEKDIEKNISKESPNYSSELFKAFKNIFVINNINRKGYLLDEFGKPIFVSDPTELNNGGLLKTPNILSAMNGQLGEKIGDSVDKLDYAKPIMVDGKVNYILYIKYNKEGLDKILDRLKSIIFYSVIVALAVSVILGYLLAEAITGPISTLIKSTEKMAAGEFENIVDNQSGDELGKLTNSFNYMSNELKNTLSEISRERSKLVTILLHMVNGVIAFDLDGKIIHANPVAIKIFEIDVEKDSFDLIFSKASVPITKEEITSLKAENNIIKDTIYKDKYYKISFASFKNEEEIAGIIVVVNDVTEQQKLENMRKEFVANVSHELKTPLTSIKTYAETLIDGALEEKEVAVDFLNVINSESDRMTRIVSDLLQLSRLDYKEARWHKVKISINDLAEEVIDKIKIETEKKKQVFVCSFEKRISFAVADKDGFVQVLFNIISNAIKYTPDGGKIEFTSGMKGKKPFVKVKDNGIGIPTKDLPRIFERFYRIDKARSREMGGTGLGLSIAREIIEANGGSISIESTLGKGTEVTITLLPWEDEYSVQTLEKR